MRRLGLYVHIPFCQSKCRYCDFYSAPFEEVSKDAYVQTLKYYFAQYRSQSSPYRVDTVFFGGGTPSQLSSAKLKELLKAIKSCFKLESGAEVSIELNPDDCNVKLFKSLLKAGFNRFSLGCQSADDTCLRVLGRRHDFEQVRTAVRAAREAGVKNLSLDVMFGLPGQTLTSFLQELNCFIALQPQHISLYALTLEEGTPLWQQRQTLSFPSEDEVAEMYLQGVASLEQRGYFQYEISNFARHGYECRHNLRYWHCEEYLGFGPGAHSYFGNKRFSITEDVQAYIASPQNQEPIIEEYEEISREERLGETVMLSLRLCEGLDTQAFAQQFRRDFDSLFGTKLAPFEQEGLVMRRGDRVYLTPRGMLLSNTVLAELLENVPLLKSV